MWASIVILNLPGRVYNFHQLMNCERNETGRVKSVQIMINVILTHVVTYILNKDEHLRSARIWIGSFISYLLAEKSVTMHEANLALYEIGFW